MNAAIHLLPHTPSRYAHIYSTHIIVSFVGKINLPTILCAEQKQRAGLARSPIRFFFFSFRRQLPLKCCKRFEYLLSNKI